jgi:hypothetical protein
MIAPRLVVFGMFLACSGQPAQPIAPPTAPIVTAQRSPPSDGWLLAPVDEVFSVEAPRAAEPSANLPHLWHATPSDELSYLFGYIELPGAVDQLGTVAENATGFLKSRERTETKTVAGRPALRIWGTTPANRAAQVLVVADADRLFILQVIGTASLSDIERFFGSLKIR